MHRFLRCAAFLLLTACGGMAGIVIDGLHDDIEASDVAIVLGSKVIPDGTPSARLQARLDKAVALYRQGMFRRIIVSGGTGVEGFSEAAVMADYLARQQIPRTDIILDEYGNTTQLTARNSAIIMKEQGFASAMVITQYFHITRSHYALHRAGVTKIHAAHANYFEVRDIYSIPRELVALPVYLLRRP